jgi:hypothetical protein
MIVVNAFKIVNVKEDDGKNLSISMRSFKLFFEDVVNVFSIAQFGEVIGVAELEESSVFDFKFAVIKVYGRRVSGKNSLEHVKSNEHYQNGYKGGDVSY